MQIDRVNLAITNNPKGGLLRGVAVSTACVIIRRTPATQAQSRQKIIEKSSPLGRKAFLRHPSVHD